METLTTNELQPNGYTPDFRTLSHNVGEKVGVVASEFADTASEYVVAGRQYVKQNPEKGMMFAALAGVVAGSLLTLALRRRP